MGLTALLALAYSAAFFFAFGNNSWWLIISSLIGFSLLLILSLYIILLESEHSEVMAKQTLEIEALKKEVEELRGKNVREP